MSVSYPPDRLFGDHRQLTVFLAGAIDMGLARNWQEEVVNDSTEWHYNRVHFYNPRRKDWDASWEQSIDNPKFVEQVNWELDFLERADVAFFFFPGTSKAPISFFELGWALAKKENVIVAAENDFYRRGNLEVICNRAGIPLYSSLKDATFDIAKFAPFIFDES